MDREVVSKGPGGGGGSHVPPPSRSHGCRRTYPEVGHGVDFHRFLYEGIRSVNKLLPGDDAGIIDEDGDITDLPLHLGRHGGLGGGGQPIPKQLADSCP